jgi:hypothetical protein
VLSNYDALVETFHEIMSGLGSNSEVRSKATGLYYRMQKIELLFGVMLGPQFFGTVDSLSCTLQAPNITAYDAKHASMAVCKSISDKRSDSDFDALWEKAVGKAQEL